MKMINVTITIAVMLITILMFVSYRIVSYRIVSEYLLGRPSSVAQGRRHGVVIMVLPFQEFTVPKRMNAEQRTCSCRPLDQANRLE